MKLFFFFLFLGVQIHSLFSQNDTIRIDEKYLEDQLYAGFTYNTFSNTPKGLQQNGFSYGVSFGFIKDIPFNEKRNVGVGLGIGFANNTFNQNVLIESIDNSINFRIPTVYTSNRYTINSIEFPIELRWRTSTLDKYKFWRVYSGLTVSYVLSFRAKYVDETQMILQKNINEVNKLQYGLSIAAGYGTWNFYANYSLTPVFKKETVLNTGEAFDVHALRLGLMFYIF